MRNCCDMAAVMMQFLTETNEVFYCHCFSVFLLHHVSYIRVIINVGVQIDIKNWLSYYSTCSEQITVPYDPNTLLILQQSH